MGKLFLFVWWTQADRSRFSSIRLLLTNTLVPRDTKSLVAGVSAKRLAQPHVVDPIMEAIQEISDEAKHLLGGAQVERSQLVTRLEVSLLSSVVPIGQS